ncbi:MAG: hypothetical protein AB8G22_00965 [Saprospiraceae bacterium]
MANINLESIWEQSEDQATAYYQAIEADVLNLAQARSTHIIQKIKYVVYCEWAIGILIWSILVFKWWNPQISWVLLLGGALLFWLSWLPYRAMFRKMNILPSKNVMESIEAYIEILQSFLRHSKIAIFSILPLGIALGVYITTNGGLDQEHFNLTALLNSAIIRLPLIALVTWFLLAKYMRWLYVKPMEEMQEILRRLKEVE